MTHVCLRCSKSVENHFRLVLVTRTMERLGRHVAHQFSTLVRTANQTCHLSMADQHSLTWLETGRWPIRDGHLIGPRSLSGDGLPSVTQGQYATA